MFFVLALLVHAGQHGSGRWPYLLPLMASGVLGGILCAVLALSVTRHGTRPHEKAAQADAAQAEAAAVVSNDEAAAVAARQA